MIITQYLNHERWLQFKHNSILHMEIQKVSYL